MKAIRKDCHLGVAVFCAGFTLIFEAFERSKSYLYPNIGFIKKQVKSPDLFNLYFAVQGIDTEMLGIDMSPCDLDNFSASYALF
jgi:hypothetical protein